MTNERIAEIRRLATPATNARQLTRMLHETLDALESVTAAVREDWTSGMIGPQQLVVDDDTRATTEYGPGLADELLSTSEQLYGVAPLTVPDAVIAEKVGPEETQDTRPMKRPGKEKR